jgi:hypothetical protein
VCGRIGEHRSELARHERVSGAVPTGLEIMTERGWRRPFDEPIEVDGRKPVMLLDAGEYIAALPKNEHDALEWRATMEALLLVSIAAARRCSLASASCGR